MADQPKKPRNIKDLKARLGRTIAPQQGESGGPVPPPNLGSPGGGGGGGASGTGAGSGGGQGGSAFPGADVAPPPFLQKKKKRKAADPFAAGEAPAEGGGGAREVRLVVDENPVDDSEVGRVQRFRTILIAVGVAVVAMGLGYGAGSTMADRRQYNAAVREGHELYNTVRERSGTVQQAKRLVDQAVAAAKGRPGKDPKVDYEALTELRAIEKPFSAADFARKRYQAFKPSTVDGLFEYYNDVNLAWDKITSLAARTLGERRRAVLDEAAEAVKEATAMQTGCVPDEVEEQIACGLVYVHPRTEDDGLGPGEIYVSQTPSGRTFKKTVFTGGEVDEDSDVVILTDTRRSLGVLGERASEFNKYQRDLNELKELTDKAMESQGRLERELGEVASLEEVFAF